MIGASERTLQAIEKLYRCTVANDYSYLSLDLGFARTNIEIATNAITLLITKLTGTAELKLFDTTKDPIPLVEGMEIAILQRATLYLTNTAQSGLTLEMLVLKAV